MRTLIHRALSNLFLLNNYIHPSYSRLLTVFFFRIFWVNLRMMSQDTPILTVENLTVEIKDSSGRRLAVDDLSFELYRGQTLAIVGESGSGKSLTALSMLKLLPTPPARVTQGSVIFNGRDLLQIPDREMRRIRGSRIAMIFQEPTTSLDPLMPVGQQIGEAIRVHHRLDRTTTREQVLALMETVGIPDPKRRYRSYPHQLSGGIRQRVIIAAALSCRPDILLADEPTSALDTTVQAQIVDLLSRLISDLGMSVVLIAHDLGVVSALADKVIVLLRGRVMEAGTVQQILKDPLHPYTQALLAARPLTKDTTPDARFVANDEYKIFKNSGQISCPFTSVCGLKSGLCDEKDPRLVDIGEGRKVRCAVVEARYG